MNKDRIIRKVTERYSIFLGKSEQSEFENLVVYKIINTETGVIEGETSILGRALKYCMAFDEEIREAEQVLNSENQLPLELMDTNIIPN